MASTNMAKHLLPQFVIDASGRDTFLANKLRNKNADKNNNTAAVFAHFKGIGPNRQTRLHLVHLG
jgi:hypothetical protein